MTVPMDAASKHISRRRTRNSGFTLIEVVIAITLMAVLMAVLFEGLRLGANAWRRGQQKLEENAAIVAGQDLLARQVAGARPRTLTEKEDEKQVQFVSFRGSQSEARFLTAESWQSDRTRPLFVARYRVAALRQGGNQLFISERGVTDVASMQLALSANPAFNPIEATTSFEQPIGSPAQAIALAYLQPATVQAPQQWVSDWIAEKHDDMPRAIRVTWTYGSGRTATSESATLLVPITRDPRSVLP